MGESLPRLCEAPASPDAALLNFCAHVLGDLPNLRMVSSPPPATSGFQLWHAHATAAEDAATGHVHAGNFMDAGRALKVAALCHLIASRQAGEPHDLAEGRGAAAKNLAAGLRFEGTQLTIYEVSAGPWNVTGYLRSAGASPRHPLVVMLPSAEASAELLYLLFADEFHRAGIACMCVDVAPCPGFQSTAVPGRYMRDGLARRLLDVASGTIDFATEGATLIDLASADAAVASGLSQDARVSRWVTGAGVFPWSGSAPAVTPASAPGIPHLHVHGERDSRHDITLTLSAADPYRTPASRAIKCDWTGLGRRISRWVIAPR
jgi:hypothetical protein